MYIVSLIKFSLVLIIGYTYNKINTNCLRKILEKVIVANGLFMIKMVQWLSTRPDVLSPNLREICLKFTDKCPYHSFEYTNSLLKKIPKTSLTVESICKNPIASGSIAQVYKATVSIKNTRKKVAIKIMHPDVGCNIREYFVLFGIFIKFASVIYKIGNIDMEKFMDMINTQINFEAEASNAQKMYNTFKNDSGIIIPEVIYFNKDLIVYSYEHSREPEAFLLIKNQKEKRKIMIKFVYAALKPLLMESYFHGDLHRGNWGVNENNDIVLYDFGYIGHFDKLQFKRILKAISISNFENYLYTIFKVHPKNLAKCTISLDPIQEKFSSKLHFKKFYENFALLSAKYNYKIDDSVINIGILTMILEYNIKTYNINNNVPYFQLLYEELISISTDEELSSVIEGLISFCKDYKFIRERTTKMINNARRSLHYSINDDEEKFILSILSLVQIYDSINSLEIIDIINYIDKHMENDKLKYHINNFLNNNKKNDALSIFQLYNFIVDNISNIYSTFVESEYNIDVLIDSLSKNTLCV